MIDGIIRGFLGPAGSRLLDFYVEHNFWINAALFGYAILVVFARRNYGPVSQQILAGFLHEHGDRLPNKSPKEVRALLSKWNIPWERGMQASRFPFIASPQGLLLYWKSDRTFERLFPLDVLADTVVRQTSSRRH